jgi:Polyketide cyclase / dehydrase and lipid transport
MLRPPLGLCATMFQSDYDLRTRWELEATPREVYDLLADLTALPRWWPAACLDARPVRARGEAEVEVLVAAFLPLTLRCRVRATAERPGERIAVQTAGDLEGVGVWAFEPGERGAVVRFHWRGRLRKSALGQVPTFVRPLFMASYRWAMERGFTSLLLEVWRRRAADPAARDWLPRPPGPVFPHDVRRWWIDRRGRTAVGKAPGAPAADAGPRLPREREIDDAAPRET